MKMLIIQRSDSSQLKIIYIYIDINFLQTGLYENFYNPHIKLTCVI
jgi:hypothetical protein